MHAAQHPTTIVLHTRSILSFDRLPLEIIIMIFRWLTDLTPVEMRADSMTLPRLVCHAWKALVDNTPSLWTNLANAPLPLAIAKSAELLLLITERGIGDHLTRGVTKQDRLATISTVSYRIWKLSLKLFTFLDLTFLLPPSTTPAPSFPQLHILYLIEVGLTRQQWCLLIDGCPALQTLGFQNLLGDFAGDYEPMAQVTISEHTALICTVKAHQAQSWGLMFGLQWMQLQRVVLQVECATTRQAQDIQGHVTMWAAHWIKKLDTDRDPVALVCVQLDINVPQPGFTSPGQEKVTSTVLATFFDNPILKFQLITTSRHTNGIPPTSWNTIPLLQRPLPGHTHLVIHPAHRSSMADFNPKLFIKHTHPNSVAIGDPVHPITFPERGRWLSRLWKARLRGRGWRNIENMESEGAQSETKAWVEAQCKAAKEDLLNHPPLPSSQQDDDEVSTASDWSFDGDEETREYDDEENMGLLDEEIAALESNY